MKIYDFDEKFYEYVRTWMALHPGLTDKQVEASYNEMMRSWLKAPAQWLGGVKPCEYFDRYNEPKDLIKLVEEYDKRGIGLPEPLYSRVVALGETCAQPLMRVAENPERPESLRATAIALLRDIGSEAPKQLYIDLVSRSRDDNELSNMAAEILSSSDASVVDALMERYDDASEYAQMLILDICANYPGDERIFTHLMDKLRNTPEQRALYASLLGKLGDNRALDLLKSFLTLTDLTYFDYIELRSAVEELGGDPGEERTFYGDADFEAMRNM